MSAHGSGRPDMKFNIQDCTNPRYAADGRIDVDLHATHDDGKTETMPFTSDPKDNTPYGPEIHKMALAGAFGPIAPYVKP